MPPRISLPRVGSAQPSPILTNTSLPFRSQICLVQQARHASILGSLSDVKEAYNPKIRRGRGPSSGKGKTSGRGHKGQKQHGKVPARFTGGQTPDHVVHGKHGEPNQFALDLAKVNLDRIQSWIDQGRIDSSKPITLREMHKSRLTHGIKDGVKLLARNASDLRTPIHITVSRASTAAIAAVEAIGGTVQTRYYTNASIRRILKGDTHPTLSLLSQAPPGIIGGTRSVSPTTSDPASPATQASSSLENPHDAAQSQPASGLPSSSSSPPPTKSSPSNPQAAADAARTALINSIRQYRYRLPDPAKRKDLEYYRDPAHRGYLAYQLQEGQGPSLFFKSPAETRKGGVGGGKRRVRGEGSEGGKRRETGERLW